MCFSAAIPQDTPVGLSRPFHMPATTIPGFSSSPQESAASAVTGLKVDPGCTALMVRNIVQRRRTHRITQIFPLQRFPLFPGNRHSKIIGIKIRCTGHGQDLSRLHVQPLPLHPTLHFSHTSWNDLHTHCEKRLRPLPVQEPAAKPPPRFLQRPV